jgi:uncharacterized protein (TIGR00251 family)
MSFVEATSDGVKLFVKVIPNASKNELAGVVGDRVKIRVQAPPESGRANKAVCLLLATALGLKRNAVDISCGCISVKKTITLRDISLHNVKVKLGL